MIPDNPTKKPPCAEWSVWVGREIEGTEDLHVPTLFIRSLFAPDPKTGVKVLLAPSLIYLRAKELGIERVWFCEEFCNAVLIADALQVFPKVCVAIDCTESSSVHTLRRLRCIESPTPPNLRIYLKMGENFELNAGDFVCFGEKYGDTAYQLIAGSGVTSELYEEDERWY